MNPERSLRAMLTPAIASSRYASVSTLLSYTPAFLSNVILSGEIAEGWLLRAPLAVNFEIDEDGSYIVSDDIYGLFGAGETRAEALRDYVYALCEYYELLASHTDEPTVRLFKHFSKLLYRYSA